MVFFPNLLNWPNVQVGVPQNSNYERTGPFGTGGTVYSATVNSYNARDQVTRVRQYQGPETSSTYQDTITTYDGYGRRKTSHAPEQQVDPNNSSSTDHTKWEYKLDDTVEKITDARGASQTFSYNNARHLVTGVTYTAPSGITAAAPVTYAYDAAGNRTSMTDGFGSVSYTYDQLSRMTSETRVFNGLGTYPINYVYNLANQLQSVTDPFGAQIGYVRDSVGRTTSITGSGFAGISRYVSNIQYRAWGAPKSASFDNNTSSTTTYTARLQPWQFRLTNDAGGSSVIREDYSYYGDGSLSLLTDLDDTAGSNPPSTLRFLSRGFSYDNVGRVTSGYGTHGLIPFSQDYGYDAFGNMSSRSGSYYNYTGQVAQSDTATYTNNRRGGWNYDADGRVTGNPASSTDDAHSLSYDAAGRVVTNIDYAPYTTITYGSGYDGDGQLAFESSQFYSYSASYTVRSSVLGKVLTRLDQSGNKKITHVPAEGLLFATQRTDVGNYVLWTQRNPLGITETGKATYDALGNYIPFRQMSDPRPAPGSYSSASLGGLSSSLANPDAYGMGCLMDGMPTSCNRVLRAINNGERGTLMIDGRQNPNVVLGNSGWFLVDRYGRFGGRVDDDDGTVIQSSEGERTKVGTDVFSTNNFMGLGFGGVSLLGINPQNSDFNMPGIAKWVDLELAESDCLEFARTVLNTVSKGKGGSLADAFNAFLGQSKAHDLFTRIRPEGSRGEATLLGKLKDSTASMYLRKSDVEQTWIDADNVIQELFHLVGDVYSDEQLARGLLKTAYSAEAAQVFPDGTANIFDKRYIARGWSKADGYSTYFHAIAHIHCGLRSPNTYKKQKK